MKNTLSAANKFGKQYDNELKDLLAADLKAYKSKNNNVRQLISVFTITAA
jgi:hypothetical protein